MLKSNPLLSLVVPLYNEEENVFILCEKVERALTNYKYELILIDDCSNDNTIMVKVSQCLLVLILLMEITL